MVVDVVVSVSVGVSFAVIARTTCRLLLLLVNVTPVALCPSNHVVANSGENIAARRDRRRGQEPTEERSDVAREQGEGDEIVEEPDQGVPSEIR